MSDRVDPLLSGVAPHENWPILFLHKNARQRHFCWFCDDVTSTRWTCRNFTQFPEFDRVQTWTVDPFSRSCTRFRFRIRSDIPAGHCQRILLLRKVQVAGDGHCRLRLWFGHLHIRPSDRVLRRWVRLARCHSPHRESRSAMHNLWSFVPTSGTIPET